jgi:hypothetical protein
MWDVVEDLESVAHEQDGEKNATLSFLQQGL